MSDIATRLELHADTCERCNCEIGAPLEREAVETLRRWHQILTWLFRESCGSCASAAECEFAFDPYNLDCCHLDCLGAK